jgi:cytochrome P450/NADPH-cytochrome P450 reductase
MSTIPPNAYKPFGTGQRACIGRQFALQEAVLVLGMLLQRFEFIKDPNYQLHAKVTLTVKPADFHIQVRRRTDRPIDKRNRSLYPHKLRPSPDLRLALRTIRR